ncbi:AsmA family protein [Phenylobacterium sp.]|uniref:AsmA family protein n=1 Tax=Phenylobacterium sp. TaxID=1871053 RepID=UPI0025DB942F|nr:AsmA family protein [Phenylobacterium sp.]
MPQLPPGLSRCLAALRRRAAETQARGVTPDARASLRRGALWSGGVLGAVLLVLGLFLLLFDWNLLRGPIGALASARLGREVMLAGDLEARPWSLRPSASINGLSIADPEWAGEGKTLEIERLTVQMELLPLFRGRTILSRLELTRPVARLRRDAEGRATWDFSKPGETSEPVDLPAIRRFIIEGGELSVVDAQRGLRFSGRVDAREVRGGDSGFALTGDGELNDEAFRLRVNGGPLINVNPDEPYPFDADIRAGATRVTAKGALPEPFDLGRFGLDLTAEGPDLARLYGLTGLALPNTPPYRLSGRLLREGQIYRLDDLGGRLGDSDLSGSLRVDVTGDRPFLSADLRSRRLDLDDLATLFGGAPSTGTGETASAPQEAMARRLRAERRLFPDTTLDVRRIRSMDAELTYRADAIEAPNLPLRGAKVRLTLEEGFLDAQEVVFSLPQGAFAGRISLDARPETPITDLDMRLTRARLEQLLPAGEGGVAPLSGDLVGRVKLRGAGASVHRAFANAEGEALLVVPQGEIREAFAELIGINVTRGLGLLLTDDQSRSPVRCAVAHFKGSGGVLRADHIVFDTEPVLGRGEGEIDLGRERIDFRLDGEPKEARLIRLMAPVTVRGPMLAPEVGVEAAGAIAQGGLAAALSVVAAPLAALLPFIDPGLAEDAACGALIADARKAGAPAN